MSIVMENQTQNVTPPNKKPFDPSVPGRAYTVNQWRMKEDWYTAQVNAIFISPAPSVSDIQDTASRIDALLTVARLDYSYINQNYDKYAMLLKIEEKKLFVDLKLQPPKQYSTLKLTIDEMKGVVASVIAGNGWDGGKLTLYELVQESSARNIFMEGVIKALEDKKDLLITHSGMMKIEHSITSISSSVPKGSVPNGM